MSDDWRIDLEKRMRDDPDRVLSMVRRFEASPEGVYDAWTDPKTAGLWLFTGPTSTAHTCEMDARPGGRWTVTDTRGGVTYTAVGEFIITDRPHRVQLTFGMPMFSSQFDLISVTFEADGDGCIMRFRQEGIAQEAKVPSESGWTPMFQGLAGAIGVGAPDDAGAGVRAEDWRARSAAGTLRGRRKRHVRLRLITAGVLAVAAMIGAAPALAQPDFATAFKRLDRNHDGALSLGELTPAASASENAALADRNTSLSPKEFEQFVREHEVAKFKAADANGDGVLVGAEIDGLARPLARDSASIARNDAASLAKRAKMTELVTTTCLGYDRNGDGRVTLDEVIEARLVGIVQAYARGG